MHGKTFLVVVTAFDFKNLLDFRMLKMSYAETKAKVNVAEKIFKQQEGKTRNRSSFFRPESDISTFH